MSDVKGRDWRLFRKNLISQYGDDSAKAAWDEGCWAHEIGKVEPVSRGVPPEGSPRSSHGRPAGIACGGGFALIKAFLCVVALRAGRGEGYLFLHHNCEAV